MKGRLGVVAIVVVALAIVVVWLGRRAEETRVSPSATATGSGFGVRGGGTHGIAQETERALPAWFARSGLPNKRIAGRVTAEGKPVDGASVTLHSILTRTNSTAVVMGRTGPDGTFDFGLRLAAYYDVAASAPGLIAHIESVNLADPVRKPAADRLELKLSGCASTIVGTIMDSSGGPIVGASVRMRGIVGTDANAGGMYKLCVPRALIELEFSADGYGGVVIQVNVQGDTEKDVVLVPEASISVFVVRASTGAPVADAYVAVNPTEWGIERRGAGDGLTNAEGRVRIAQLTPGNYRVFGSARGLVAEGSLETVAEIGTSPEVVLKLAEATRISGRVMRGDKPVVGAEVKALRTAPMHGSTPSISQEDGSFVLEEVPLGDLILVAHPHKVKSPTTIRAEAGRPHRDVIVQVEPLGAIRGVVTRGGKPVPSAEVCCIQDARGGQSAKTDGAGHYQFVGVQPGMHELLASVDDAFVLPTKLTLGLGEERKVDFELDMAGTIAGTVVDKAGNPVPRVFVQWVHEKTGDLGRGTTDAQGRYRCGAMTGGGMYRASVSVAPEAQKAFPTANGGPYPELRVADGKALIEGVTIAIDLQRLKISGRVVDTQGAGVADATVKATLAGGEAPRFQTWEALPSTVADADGNFTLDGLLAGTYALQARSADGGEGIVANIAGGASAVVVRVQRPATIEGRLVGFAAAPVVYATPLAGGNRFTAGTGDAAAFRITGLVPGRYLVNAQTAYEGDAKTVEVASGKVAQVTLTSRGRAAIEGTVLDFRTNAPLGAAACHVVIASDGVAGVTNWDLATAPRSDERGRVLLDPAPAGSVTVECMFTSFRWSMATAEVTVAAGGRATVQLYAAELLAENPSDSGIFLDPRRMAPVIERVRPGSSAATGGALVGDLIVAVDGVSVAKLNGSGVDHLLRSHLVGSEITLIVQRAGTRKTLSFQLQPTP